MLQIIKCKVNGVDGFCCQVMQAGKPVQTVCFTNVNEFPSLLESL